mmetsp:Transcript_10805/g.43735  ORF Transcript_10805/g.43735 Transcript_10805/m.43735 type:complete len:219 (+) Transcript_10805:1030-1686(+)
MARLDLALLLLRLVLLPRATEFFDGVGGRQHQGRRDHDGLPETTGRRLCLLKGGLLVDGRRQGPRGVRRRGRRARRRRHYRANGSRPLGPPLDEAPRTDLGRACPAAPPGERRGRPRAAAEHHFIAGTAQARRRPRPGLRLNTDDDDDALLGRFFSRQSLRRGIRYMSPLFLVLLRSFVFVLPFSSRSLVVVVPSFPGSLIGSRSYAIQTRVLFILSI